MKFNAIYMTCKHALILNIRRYLLASVQCIVRSYIVHPDVPFNDLIMLLHASFVVCLSPGILLKSTVT